MSNLSGYSSMKDHLPSVIWGLPMQVSERENEWVIRADLPEVDLAEIDVEVSNRAFTITAPSKCSLGTSDTGYYRVERQLPVGVFADEIRARYCEGVLEISLPKSQELFRRIPIEP